MKKLEYIIISFCCLFLTLFISGCNSKTTKYTINVVNGTGGGSFESGKVVTITATIPQYQEFDYWESNDIIISSDNPYTFVAKKDATYTAVFKKQKAKITVVNGIGGGTFEKGTYTTITANTPNNQEFDYWEVNGQKVSTESSYRILVTEETKYTAVFKAKIVNIQVENGIGGGEYDAGTSVTIIANAAPDECVFDYWELDGAKVSTSNPYTFDAFNSGTYTAVYRNIFRGTKKTDNTSVEIKTIEVSKGGTITIDYKYIDPISDLNNGITIHLGTDPNNCYGVYKLYSDHLDQEYDGFTVIKLNDGYIKLVINVSKIDKIIAPGSNAPTEISHIIFEGIDKTKGIYFEFNSEPVQESLRGMFYDGVSAPVFLSNIYDVSSGGVLVLDYKFADSVVDAKNGVSIFFGTDEVNRFGNYKLLYNQLERDYQGVTFIELDDGYYRMIIDVALLNEVITGCKAPTEISQISFKWFEVTQGVYFDANPKSRNPKTTEFQMDGDNFVIANFTDVHVDNLSYLSENGSVAKTIRYAIKNSNPDILVFSGDVAGSTSDLSYLCSFLDSFEIPYFFILGNHDHEGSLGYDEIEKRVNLSAYGYIEKGPDNLDHKGNYTIKIKNSDGQVVHALVMMNSGNKYTVTDDSLVEYVDNPISGVKYGTYNSKKTYCYAGYDGIKGDQITWYENTVQSLNCETTIICHIPFIEYCKAYEQYQDALNKHDEAAIAACGPIGECTMGEQICGPVVNFGLFASILKCGSTKNVICGHDHVNDFSLLYQGVRLTYALKTGEGAYWLATGYRNGYTLLTIDSTGGTSLEQIYYNPLK